MLQVQKWCNVVKNVEYACESVPAKNPLIPPVLAAWNGQSALMRGCLGDMGHAGECTSASKSHNRMQTKWGNDSVVNQYE